MKEVPQISESESEVMRLLWKVSPLTSNEIINELSDRMNWSDQTIKTFINRLLNKEAIRFEKSGRNYNYYPVISQDEYFKAENKTFLERVYKGAANLLFSKFLEEEKLSEEDISRLQRILEEKKKGGIE
jgi:BlaI family penicillinase repressor